MPIDITIPRLGWSMEEGIFVGWHKQDGDAVKPGDVLFSLEGDKAIQEIECLDAGVLRIPPTAPEPGTTVSVGVVVGFIVQPGETIAVDSEAAVVADELVASREGEAPAEPQPRTNAREFGSAGASPSRADLESRTNDTGGQAARGTPRTVAISPRALRVARELDVDWTQLHGSGRTGRVRERDVRAAAAERHLPSAPTRIPISPLRREIANRLSVSVQSAVPVTLTTTADATQLVRFRTQFRAAEADSPGAAIGYTEFFVKLCAAALRQHPLLNSKWNDDAIVLHHEIHIGIAVDTDAGLLVPVIRNVPELSLRQIAIQSRDLIARARERRLRPEELQGGTFTVTNLGAFGIDAFTPVINPPQCAVLGIGRIARQPAIVDDHIEPRDQVTLSLTFDHRIVDGAPAARFLQSLVTIIENPGKWLTGSSDVPL